MFYRINSWTQFCKSMCAMCKCTSIKWILKKMLFCSINISAEILLHVLGYKLYAERQISVHFSKMLLPLTSLKMICTIADLPWRQICWWNDPWLDEHWWASFGTAYMALGTTYFNCNISGLLCKSLLLKSGSFGAKNS